MKKKHQYSNAIVTGSIAYDEIMNFPQMFVDYFHPEKLHQINVSFVVNNLEKQLGGTATNIAYNLKMLTAKKVSLLASVGKDGKDFIGFYKKNKIDTKNVLVDKKLYTATGKVITDIKDNQIWGFYYGACERAKDLDLSKCAISESIVIISANHPKAFLNFQKQAIKLKVDYMYDPGMAVSWIDKKDLKEGIEHCRILVGNDYEISQISRLLKINIDDYIKKGKIVITTLGEEGVKYQDNKNEYLVSGYRIKKIIDPTGAGDAWRGGFVAGLLNGDNVVDCLKQGNALASFAVEKYGTVNHKPTRKEIQIRIKKITKSKTQISNQI